MFWNKKEEKHGLPDLPPLALPQRVNRRPEKPAEEDLEEDKHALPSFPDSPISKGFSQAAIKEAVSENEDNDVLVPRDPTEREIKTDSLSLSTVEIDALPTSEEMRPSMISPPPAMRESKIVKEFSVQPKPITLPPPTEPRNSDIFVKIEKFRTARRSLADVKERLDEVNEMLKKIREMRLREEQELSSWEKEVATAKAQVDNVTQNIFEKID